MCIKERNGKWKNRKSCDVSALSSTTPTVAHQLLQFTFVPPDYAAASQHQSSPSPAARPPHSKRRWTRYLSLSRSHAHYTTTPFSTQCARGKCNNCHGRKTSTLSFRRRRSHTHTSSCPSLFYTFMPSRSVFYNIYNVSIQNGIGKQWNETPQHRTRRSSNNIPVAIFNAQRQKPMFFYSVLLLASVVMFSI